VTWDKQENAGYISKLNRVTIVDTFSTREVYTGKGNIVPKHVIEQVNLLLKQSS
jgi:hypothetical protein